jgi:hypothetical protein
VNATSMLAGSCSLSCSLSCKRMYYIACISPVFHLCAYVEYYLCCLKLYYFCQFAQIFSEILFRSGYLHCHQLLHLRLHIDSTPSVVKTGITMTFPPNADENAAVAWPEPQSPIVERDSLRAPPPPGADIDRQNTTTSSIGKSGERRMGWKDFVNISISMAGAQIAWTLELGYGMLINYLSIS